MPATASSLARLSSEFPAVCEILSVMKAKLEASRSLLYECSRFVDIYKIYDDIAKERPLTPEERKGGKILQQVCRRMHTPLSKVLAVSTPIRMHMTLSRFTVDPAS